MMNCGCCGGLDEMEFLQEYEKAKPHNLFDKSVNHVQKISILAEPEALLHPNHISETFAKREYNKDISCVPRCDAFFDAKESAIYMLFDMAGISKDSIKVDIGEGLVTVTGKKTQNELGENYGEQLTIHIQERTSGFFYRQFRLPPNTLESTGCAGFMNGVLELKLNCVQTQPTRSLPIQDGRAKQEAEKKDAKKK